MKVLSLLQPWATLVMLGAKQFECRSWQTAYRGPLLIHASAKKPSGRAKLFFEQSEYFKKYITDMDQLPYGSLIAEVKLTQIYKTAWLVQNLEMFSPTNWQQEFAFDDYAPNRYAWKFEEPRKLDFFLPTKGTLGLWEYNGLI